MAIHPTITAICVAVLLLAMCGLAWRPTAPRSRLHKSLRMASSAPKMSAISVQMKEMRAQMATDEKTRLMMDALRGKNLNEDDRQGEGVNMRVVETRVSEGADDVLPTTYDPEALQAYFSKRPSAIFQRLWQILSASSSFFFSLAVDAATGQLKDAEVRRAAELRRTIVSLGPFFIKLGQALSIRPDILSPRAMVELQQLCDKVPCFDNALAMKTIVDELGAPVDSVFSNMSADPVAAASLGQVYRATLAATGEEVAVKVQRPFVLETVSLDLYLIRQLGLILRNFPDVSSRLDIVSLLDEFAGNFYQELDYNLECQNGLRIAEDMKRLPMVVIPKNYPSYTSRRVHTAQWVDGEKLSQSTAGDVGALVNLGVITYLTQLLDTGFFHADPHPGNMLRTPDGKLVILDFGLMTKITDDQKYGMIEAIAHLIHRDYSEIGNDFVSLDFIPRGTDTAPIIPALARVFDAALSGGGAKSINFQALSADLAEITFKFPFRIPPYFALIIRAISVLEGIALVGNPEFAIVDEAYPYISKRLLTDESPRLKAAFKYMVYGKSDLLDIDRVIDMLTALEKFVAVKDFGDGSAFKSEGLRGQTYVGRAGDTVGSRKVEVREAPGLTGLVQSAAPRAAAPAPAAEGALTREALKFFFGEDGVQVREFVLEEITSGVDALSRDAVRELVAGLGLRAAVPPLLRSLAPRLDEGDRRKVESLTKLVRFLSQSGASSDGGAFGGSNLRMAEVVQMARRPENQKKLRELLPTLQAFAEPSRQFGLQVAARLAEKSARRFIRASVDVVFGMPMNRSSLKKV